MAKIEKLRNKWSEFRQADSKARWLVEQWKWRYFTFRHKKQLRLNEAFDREHNVETAMEVPLGAAGVSPADVARGNVVYRPITEALFRAAIGAIAIDPAKFTFVDIGSGMGKVLFMAADYPFERIVGIEYAGGLHEIALRNVATYRSATRKCGRIEPVHADALLYELPGGPLLLFIFNALAKDIMLELLKRLDRSTAERAQPTILIYTNIRTVAEVGDIFSGLENLRVLRKARNYVVVADADGAGMIQGERVHA